MKAVTNTKTAENTIAIGNYDLQIKEYNGKRVITFKDIDNAHGRIDGTARQNFNNNRKHFIENVDYFIVTHEKLADATTEEVRLLNTNFRGRGLTLLTETGYLMLIKSFNDKLAWNIQRELVNSYFKVENFSCDLFTRNELENIAEQLTNYGIILNTLMETTKVKQEEQKKALCTVKKKLMGCY